VLTIVKTGASVLTAACLVVGLAACSSDGDTGASASHSASVDAQHQALEKYATQARASLASQDFTKVYKDIKVDVSDPGTVTFTYVYVKPVDAAKAASILDGEVATLQSDFDSTVSPAMEAAGVTSDRKAVYVYRNSDGSQLWTHTFEEQ
jgi:hypothetical protein